MSVKLEKNLPSRHEELIETLSFRVSSENRLDEDFYIYLQSTHRVSAQGC